MIGGGRGRRWGVERIGKGIEDVLHYSLKLDISFVFLPRTLCRRWGLVGG